MLTSLRALSLAIACVGVVSTANAQALSSVEEQLAARLADPAGAIQSAAMLHPDAVHSRGTPNRVVVTRIEAVRNDGGQRLALVTLFQYEGSITTSRLVDLDSNTILNERVSRDLGTPVADVEAEYAHSLLMGDARIRELLAPFQGQVEISLIPVVIDDPADPMHGKRLARVVLNTPAGFVSGVDISVNLSDATVDVQQ